MDKFYYSDFNKKRKNSGIFILMVTTLLIPMSTNLVSNTEAHSGTLLDVNGKDYWIWVDAIEPASIDVMGGGDVYISEADPQDPLNADSNKTKPVGGMEEILKFNVIADGKNKTIDLHQVWNSSGPEIGHYEAPFIHTVNTPYEYQLYGNWDGTQFAASWTCTPGTEPEYKQTNGTVTLSEGVTQKAESGPFSCPKPISEVSFPEPSISNVEIQNKLNGTNTANTN